MKTNDFQIKIYTWYHQNKRSFPWRVTVDPYKIMVSEFMLQQTQTQRVLPKYIDFITRFPSILDLSQAPLVEVLKLWQGLGYNSRGKRLQDSAIIIVNSHGGTVPRDAVTLQSLPGIGAYTSKAIMTFAHNKPEVFIETNIRTVFLHFFFKKQFEISDKEILEKIAETVDSKNPREWYYALMDYGVMLKQTIGNQNKKSKHYSKQSKFKGSNRQIRGAILKSLLDSSCDIDQLEKILSFDKDRIKTNLEKLELERMIVSDKKDIYSIPRNS